MIEPRGETGDLDVPNALMAPRDAAAMRASTRPEDPSHGHQSRYFAGTVSGMAAHSNAVAMADTAAKIRKPSP